MGSGWQTTATALQSAENHKTFPLFFRADRSSSDKRHSVYFLKLMLERSNSESVSDVSVTRTVTLFPVVLRRLIQE